MTSAAPPSLDAPRAVATPPGGLLVGFLAVAFAFSGVTVTIVVARRMHEAGGPMAAVVLGYLGLLVFAGHLGAGVALVRGHRAASRLALGYAGTAVVLGLAELVVVARASLPATPSPLQALGYARVAIAALSIGWAFVLGGLAWRWRGRG